MFLESGSGLLVFWPEVEWSLLPVEHSASGIRSHRPIVRTDSGRYSRPNKWSFRIKILGLPPTWVGEPGKIRRLHDGGQFVAQ